MGLGPFCLGSMRCELDANSRCCSKKVGSMPSSWVGGYTSRMLSSIWIIWTG
jgi:hypothetical protein